MLADAPIKAVFSTETYRTVMTATPMAADRGLAVQLFSTDDLSAFADKLKAKEFEKYLKSGADRAFAKKRFWQYLSFFYGLCFKQHLN